MIQDLVTKQLTNKPTTNNPWPSIYSDFYHKVVREAVVDGIEQFDGKPHLLVMMENNIKGLISEEEAGLSQRQSLIDLVGRKIYLEIVMPDRDANVVILSRKRGNERRAQITWNTIEVGHIRKGIVIRAARRNLVLFCDGIPALLPYSELSYGYVDNPAEKYRPGTELEVKVIKVRRPGEKETPPVKVQEKPLVKAGQDDDGIQVEEARIMFDPEEPADTADMVDTANTVDTADTVEVAEETTELTDEPDSPKVLRGRVVVSVKALLDDPWSYVPVKYKQGGIYRGTVRTEADKSLFIEIENGVDVRTNHAKFGNPPIGAQVLVNITKIDPTRRRINGKLARSPRR